MNMIERLKQFQNAFNNRNIIVDILCIFFGISAWIGINSTFLQMPLLVDKSPEGWSLPSYVVITVQCGNIGPLAYTLLQKYTKINFNDAYMIYTLLPIGTLAALLMAFFHADTVFIGDKETSLVFLILVFFVAFLGCTSSVLFIPYMGRFREIYLVTFLLGEGLSGLVASCVAMIQGSGDTKCVIINNSTTEGQPEYEKQTEPPLFGTKEFFVVVFATLCVGFVSFVLLDRLKLCKKEYAAVKIEGGNSYEYDAKPKDSENDKADVFVKKISSNERIILMVLMAITCAFGNSILQSVESYSTLPYSNQVYHLNVIFRSVANPAACFLAIFLPHTSIRSIIILSCLGAILTIYACLTAILSPYPPLVDTDIGGPLIIIVWTILLGLISYIKLSINCVMRAQGGKSLVWIGAFTQLGSLLGAVLIFVLINYTKIFKSYDPCQDFYKT